METLLLVDPKDNPQGKASREECHQLPGKLHRAVMVTLKNGENQILLAQRAKGKLWEGVWDGTCATHVFPDETPKQAARRALEKELNLRNVALEYRGKFLYRARWKEERVEHEVCHLFLGEIAEQPRANPKEVVKTKWVGQSDQLTPWFLKALKFL